MITVEIDHNSTKHIYIQIYEYLREEIRRGRIRKGEKLPPLRSMAHMLDTSVTTIRSAYDQLLVEGYIESKPSSGFYVADGAAKDTRSDAGNSERSEGHRRDDPSNDHHGTAFRYDPECFDFVKWKKCISSVINEMPEMLLTEGDRQGEPALRREIAEYLYRSRGVICSLDQVIISAGTQQLMNHLARILRMMGIGIVCTEDPGYLPVRNIFSDYGFGISGIPVRQDGIVIEKLPSNIRTACYICPQNQFPTGALMPVGRRHLILEWARKNDSIVIEDDYNSELRYFGRPVPALQGLDTDGRVVYIGSFSSTLFPAVRISYMVLPESMMEMYDKIRMNYDQTSSKTEQLTLALFMQRGYYQTNLRRVRNLYARKLRETIDAIRDEDPDSSFLTPVNSQSGINIILRIDTHAMTISEGSMGRERTLEIRRELVRRMISSAARAGLKIRGIDQLDTDGHIYLTFYYNQIPIGEIRKAVRDLVNILKASVMKGSLGMPCVYEVVRIRDGRPLFLCDHYERLGNSLASLGILPPFTYEEFKQHMDRMIEENNIRNHNLKIEADISGHALIYMSPTHYPDRKMYEKGVKTDLLEGERKNPNIKMMDQELRDKADQAISARGVYEVLLVGRDGMITEGSRSNVFFIKGNRVVTSPADKVLLGVTRKKIIEIIKGMGLEFAEESIKAADIREFDAAFISGTSPEVLPISDIGDSSYDVNDPVLRKIMERYEEMSNPAMCDIIPHTYMH